MRWDNTYHIAGGLKGNVSLLKWQPEDEGHTNLFVDSFGAHRLSPEDCIELAHQLLRFAADGIDRRERG